jgi:cell division protein FtsQ
MKRERSKAARRPRRWLKKPSPRALKIGAVALAFVVAAVPMTYVAYSGLPEPMRSALASFQTHTLAVSGQIGLSVQEILVDGRVETPAADVLAVLEVSRNSPILGFRPAEARAKLEKLAWVKSASVERWLPNTIYVRLAEREPLALWQRHGRLTLIDRDGAEIRGADVGHFSQLPVVVGDDAPPHAATLVALLDTEPTLARRVAAAVRVGARRWNVNLDMGDGRTIEVQLPELNPAGAWARLAELERVNGLFERNIITVDLRIPDRLVVRVIKEAPAAAPGKRGGKIERKTT